MSKTAKIVCLGLLFTTVHSTAFAGNNANEGKESFDWSPVIEAIISVESDGNPNAVSGNSCGAMQITPILVKECNLILQRRKMKKRGMRYSVKRTQRYYKKVVSRMKQA